MTEPYVNPAELPVKRRENIALGVLGALLFSAAGGLVHFGLLQLGYIAWISALVGMAAGYFGYGLFSGRKNTVHGASRCRRVHHADDRRRRVFWSGQGNLRCIQGYL